MASIKTEKSGIRRIRFYEAPGRPRQITLGKKIDKKTAERLRDDIEEILVAKQTGQAIHPATAARIGRLSPRFRVKFEQAGLLQPIAALAPKATLGDFLTGYIEARADIKVSTKDNLRQAKQALVDYFGADRPLDAVTPGEAEEFRAWLQTKRERPLAANTARRLCSRAKQFFRHAQRKRLIHENPFGDMRGLAVRGNEARRRFIDRVSIDRVLGACPNIDWRVLVVLCRYGGLRPSEACDLRWEHVDWERQRIRVHCEKTKHHEGREWREVPCFPEVVEHLREAWEAAPEGAEMVVGRYRSNQNLGTVLKKIVARAGLEVWPKPFQNLRSTRETELARDYPIHVVCSWIGNTNRVAMEHYLQVTDEDYLRAASGTEAANPRKRGPQAASAGLRFRSGPKSGPASAGNGRRERNGVQAPKTATVKNAGPDAVCRTEARGAAPCEKEPSSPSRIRNNPCFLREW